MALAAVSVCPDILAKWPRRLLPISVPHPLQLLILIHNSIIAEECCETVKGLLNSARLTESAQTFCFLSVLICFFSSVQSFSHVRLFVTPWTTARQGSLSITNSRSLLKLMSIELVTPSNHLILCRPLLLLPSIFPSIKGLFQSVSSSHQVDKVLEFQP